MKLWLVRARIDPASEVDLYFEPWSNPETTVAYVVRAETATDARRMGGQLDTDGYVTEADWLNPDWVECIELTSDETPVIILASDRTEPHLVD